MNEGWFDLVRSVIIWLAILGGFSFLVVLLLVPTTRAAVTELSNLIFNPAIIKESGVVLVVLKFIFSNIGLFVLFPISIWIAVKLAAFLGNPLQIDLRKYLKSPEYQNRIDFIERFHGDFGRILSAYSCGKVVFIFIDDLDRC